MLWGEKSAIHLGVVQSPSGYVIPRVKAPLISLSLSEPCLPVLKPQPIIRLGKTCQRGRWLPASAHLEGLFDLWKLIPLDFYTFTIL